MGYVTKVRLGVLCTMAAAALAPLRSTGAAAQPAPVRCDEWDVEYGVTARLELAETPLGQGDGMYPIGPGRMVLRFEDQAGRPGGRVKMVAYDMPQTFTVESRTLFWKTTVMTNATTTGILNPCAEPEGMLAGTTIAWNTPVRSMRTEGTLTCDGAFCGKFGAPPPGQSPLRIGPDPVLFQPFHFSADMKTFTMGKTFVARTPMPKQTSYLLLAGRETNRSPRSKTCP
ncbi:MAG TPA: hypothetical protein VEK07_01050 [Polyangiaceae bacterium]|nr:hypothetical protein [Polyangiaceae bacterium]